MNELMSSGIITSPLIKIARSPTSSRSSTLSPFSLLRPLSATDAPSAKNASAMPRPMPAVPPVIAATRPSSFPIETYFPQRTDRNYDYTARTISGRGDVGPNPHIMRRDRGGVDSGVTPPGSQQRAQRAGTLLWLDSSNGHLHRPGRSRERVAMLGQAFP